MAGDNKQHVYTYVTFFQKELSVYMDILDRYEDFFTNPRHPDFSEKKARCVTDLIGHQKKCLTTSYTDGATTVLVMNEDDLSDLRTLFRKSSETFYIPTYILLKETRTSMSGYFKRNPDDPGALEYENAEKSLASKIHICNDISTYIDKLYEGMERYRNEREKESR
ncbi:hypothetical protein [uncultured Dialister sp.]|uniref:hypothetical protein n=1 Tax=uncultured Dialister sp. TaxID=278064 RepID=UPI0025CED902|nr:hypothetical protein [uncultured Dialister sp.]